MALPQAGEDPTGRQGLGDGLCGEARVRGKVRACGSDSWDRDTATQKRGFRWRGEA